MHIYPLVPPLPYLCFSDARTEAHRDRGQSEIWPWGAASYHRDGWTRPLIEVLLLALATGGVVDVWLIAALRQPSGQGRVLEGMLSELMGCGLCLNYQIAIWSTLSLRLPRSFHGVAIASRASDRNGRGPAGMADRSRMFRS